MKKIKISVDEIDVVAEINESPTGKAIFEALPLEGKINVWGDEIYFDIPVQLAAEPEAREAVEVGDLGYWPVGAAFCIFFGPTPVAIDEKPRAYSPVNVFGRTIDDATIFRGVSQGAAVRVSAISE